MLEKLSYFRNRFLDAGIGVFIQPFIGKYNDKEYPQGYVLEERKLLSSFSNAEIIKYQLHNINPKGRLCRTGSEYFRVHPDGLIFRCANSKIVLGKIEDKEFRLLDKAMPCDMEFCMCNNESAYLEQEGARS